VMVVAGGLVAGAPVAEFVPLENARLLEQTHGAVDGRERDARIARRGAAVQLPTSGWSSASDSTWAITRR
jgi:hypothetical protein